MSRSQGYFNGLAAELNTCHVLYIYHDRDALDAGQFHRVQVVESEISLVIVPL